MSKRIKASDLEITERGFPLLVYVEPKYVGYWSDKEQKLPLLHISTRVGIKPKISKYGYDERFLVTHCNRPLRHTNIYGDGTLNTDSYRLCPRCAKQQEHKIALLEYHKYRSEQDRRRKEKQELEKKESRAKRVRRASRLAEFGSEFFEELPVEWLGRPGMAYGMRVEFIGHTYEIKEIE